MKLRTRLLLGYAVVFAVMILIAGVTLTSTRWLIASQDLVEDAYRAIVLANRVQFLATDMQSEKRGFLISGDPDILQAFEVTKKTYGTDMQRLKQVVSSSQTQVRLLEDIDALLQTWIDTVATPQMEARLKGSSGHATGEVLATFPKEDVAGRRLFRDVHQKIEALVQAQRTARYQLSRENDLLATRSVWIVILGTLFAAFFGTGVALVTTRNVLSQVGGEPADIAEIADEIGKGNLDVKLEVRPGDGASIRAALGEMLGSLKANRDEAHARDWLKTGIGRLNEVVSGDPELADLAARVVSEVATYLDAQVGALYVSQNGSLPTLALLGTYAYTKRKNLSNTFALGEGLVGQAALEKKQILVKNIPQDYFQITSGTGERVPSFICLTPFLYEGRVKGVIEIGTLHAMTDTQLGYLGQAVSAIAIAMEASERRTNLAQALAESQQLSEELQVQQEELRTTNEELEEQAKRLKESEERLKVQQEELQVTNEELEEKNELLQRQKREVERAGAEIEAKAKELAAASRYKSEFLSNMSHELRTPLNSLLLLAQLLAENKEGTLTEAQMESAHIIHRSGTDLLNLIDEILDLAKIEAGRMDLRLGSVRAHDLMEGLYSLFRPLAEQKGLLLDVEVDPAAPSEIVTDRKRLEQVIKNLVANAIKFTQSGSVSVRFDRPAPDADFSKSGLSADNSVAIIVKDTGIGIPPEKQTVIFEAFRQADGGTARKFGGTGLGLSISRELTRLLGGEIQLESAQGRGATFTMFLPISARGDHISTSPAPVARMRTATVQITREHESDLQGVVVEEITDDRESLVKSDKVILIVEDDPTFARILHERCNEKGFKCIAAPSGEIGLELALQYQPMGVILDIRLPGMDGWTVLSALKDDIRTRHIPVHVMSVEDASIESLRKGAVGHFTKPISNEDLKKAFNTLEGISAGGPKQVLVVEDDPEMRRRIVELVSDGDIKVDEAGTGEEAIRAMRATYYACVILDIGLPDLDGTELLKRLENENVALPPIIVHTARDLTQEQELAMREYADSIVLKDVRSTERLLDEVSLFLHSMVSRMPETKRQIIRNLHETDSLLKNKKVLIVDDDMRTLFALSHLLAERGMRTLKAENGERALQFLDEEPDVDIVLIDIMMPVMDGFETMGKIREQERFRRLPIIALTAKAMPRDREQCMAAGASDYMTKPVDKDRLVSLLRVWLYR